MGLDTLPTTTMPPARPLAVSHAGRVGKLSAGVWVWVWAGLATSARPKKNMQQPAELKARSFCNGASGMGKPYPPPKPLPSSRDNIKNILQQSAKLEAKPLKCPQKAFICFIRQFNFVCALSLPFAFRGLVAHLGAICGQHTPLKVLPPAFAIKPHIGIPALYMPTDFTQ